MFEYTAYWNFPMPPWGWTSSDFNNVSKRSLLPFTNVAGTTACHSLTSSPYLLSPLQHSHTVSATNRLRVFFFFFGSFIVAFVFPTAEGGLQVELVWEFIFFGCICLYLFLFYHCESLYLLTFIHFHYINEVFFFFFFF